MAKQGQFVPLETIKRSVDRFLAKHRTQIYAHTDKISYYAEISAYNAIIDLYKQLGHKVKPANFVKDKFRYKLQPTGDARKYSHFTLSRSGQQTVVLNNVRVESAHGERLYFTADIVVANANAVQMMTQAEVAELGMRRTAFAIRNVDVKTFIEVKNLPAFPELLFNFSGLLYEIMPDIFFGKVSKRVRTHLAPSLVCSFAGSGHANYIRQSLLGRWHINIFSDFLKVRKLHSGGEAIRLIADKRLTFPKR